MALKRSVVVISAAVVLAVAVWAVSAMRQPIGSSKPASSQVNTRTLTDAAGRTVALPEQIDRVICSGAGALRLLSYLGAQDRVVAVDSIEKRDSPTDCRPYALANPEFQSLPLFGEFRGMDSPELIVGLDPQPQVMFKTHVSLGQNPERVQAQTGVPVVVLEYGNLTDRRDDLNQALRLMGEALGLSERAEEVVAYFDSLIEDLAARTADIPEGGRPTCYVGGVSMRGSLGFSSTEPRYAPFAFTNARNVAIGMASGEGGTSHAVVAKEQLVAWDPEVVFLDLATARLGPSASGLVELREDRAFRNLSAVREGRVFGVIPHNAYTENFDSVFANAYFVGKTLYPERFRDVDPAAKADEIYTFLLGEPLFAEVRQRLGGLAFQPLLTEE